MLITFTSSVITGAGRGKSLGSPTLNLDLANVPAELSEGDYVIIAEVDGKKFDAVMHYGPRPVFRDVLSCEVHVLHETIGAAETVTVTVLERLRDVMSFADPADLRMQIALDIAKAEEILKKFHGNK